MTDRNIVLFGASRGIGRALAEEYGASDTRLVLCSRDFDALEELCAGIATRGGTAWPLRCDVTDPDDMRRAVDSARAHLGTIDLVIFNAGIDAASWMKDVRTGDWHRIHETNVIAMVSAMERVFPVLIEQGRGVFAGVGSLADVRGFPGSGAYCASKAAVARLLESARVEMRSHGVQILTVRPGFVRTDMTAKNEFHMPFLLSPGRAARIIRRGIAKRKRVISFPLRLVLLTRLVGILPARLFDMLAARARPEQRA